jgi:hypothetical protein
VAGLLQKNLPEKISIQKCFGIYVDYLDVKIKLKFNQKDRRNEP